MFATRVKTLSRFAVLLFLSAFMAACSMVVQTPPTASITADSARGLPTAVSGNRLLVQGRDGNIYTLDPDGGNAVALTDDASESLQYLQPSWSPDATQVAWTSAAMLDGQPESALVVADGAGENRTEFGVPFPPFYIHWSPAGTQLAYLSAWASTRGPSMALRLVDLAAGEDAVRTLAEGQPLYLSWSPDGDQMVTHISNERVEIYNLAGRSERLPAAAISFPAPIWFPSGDRLIYAVDDGGKQELIVAGLDGSRSAGITDFQGNISFTLSPDEERIAYVITPPSTGVAAFGPLFTVEINSGRTRQLSDSPVIAFFWSPDGANLAFLALDSEADELRFRWNVWDGAQIRAYDAHLPTPTFLERYLAFFDQYAQSMSIWSPDSTAFTYAGVGSDNRAGIWVQEVDSEMPRYIAPGVYAAWSPR